MRLKISREMVELEARVENMKRERNQLHKERIELEEMKKLYADSTVMKIHNLEEKIHDNSKKIHDNNEKNMDSNEKIPNEDNNDLKTSYDILNHEISKLKRYIESCKPTKSMIERSTVTDQSDTSSKSILNNEQEERHVREDLKPPNQVVNDFKKQKNVNFDQVSILPDSSLVLTFHLIRFLGDLIELRDFGLTIQSQLRSLHQVLGQKFDVKNTKPPFQRQVVRHTRRAFKSFTSDTFQGLCAL